MTLKKAAMFGLDARIALAIFGALSVISGAALYSAIQQAKVISSVAELNEFAKAVESFRLDTGQEIPAQGAYGILMAQNLVESTVSGFNGPYISFDKSTTAHYLLKNGVSAGVYNRPGTTWGDNDHSGECTVAPCAIWVSFLDDYTLEEANAIDAYVDGTTDITNGRVRAYYNTGSKYNVYLQVAPALNQP
tara:strand:+ start:3948 stop:4520 length:573 start_codon:yes stop_codon:yes gene_type:complete